ncbi:MAG: hypothetical protein NT105_23445 [Verrucomicrobia bacterium]|nr:hypothetical protein [Verrucomicrobiota bacterium]
MGQPHQFGPSPELHRVIRTLECELQSLRRLVDKTDVRLDSIERCLRQLKAVGLPHTDAVPQTGYQTPLLKPTPQTEPRTLWAAGMPKQKGVNYIGINPHASGAAAVRIDAGTEFLLPQALANLLAALKTDNHRSNDEYVGWKTLGEVTAMLAKMGEKKVTHRALVQRVYRLRRSLFVRGGVSPFLVESNRHRGVRIALRRKPPPVIGGDGG